MRLPNVVGGVTIGEFDKGWRICARSA